jgi:hypothetical protein
MNNKFKPKLSSKKIDMSKLNEPIKLGSPTYKNGGSFNKSNPLGSAANNNSKPINNK